MIVCREKDRVGVGESVKWTWSSSNNNNISNNNNTSRIKSDMSSNKGGQTAKGQGQIAAMQRGMHAKSQRASNKGEVFKEGRGQRLREAEGGEVDWVVKRRGQRGKMDRV